MPTPAYIVELRRHHGHGLLLLPGTCAVVLRDDLEPGRSHLLLTRRTDTGRWALPAGIVEPGEQPAGALEREVLEETRVQVRAERLVWLSADREIEYPNGDRCQFITTVFACRYLGGEAGVGDEESHEVAWWDVDALPELDERQRTALAHARSGRPACAFGRD